MDDGIDSCDCDLGEILFILQRGQPDQTRRNPRRDKGKMQLTKDDIENVNGAV